MDAASAVAVVRNLQRAAVIVYVGGGWGIDALFGEQSRSHADLDLSFDAPREAVVLSVLGDAGFTLVEDQRPVRFVMRHHSSGVVDLHPVVFDSSGAGVQAGFNGTVYEYPADGYTVGSLNDEPVPCFTAEQQVRFHTGYLPTDKDRRDMQLLRKRFGVRLPAAYD